MVGYVVEMQTLAARSLGCMYLWSRVWMPARIGTIRFNRPRQPNALGVVGTVYTCRGKRSCLEVFPAVPGFVGSLPIALDAADVCVATATAGLPRCRDSPTRFIAAQASGSVW